MFDKKVAGIYHNAIVYIEVNDQMVLALSVRCQNAPEITVFMGAKVLR